MKKDFTGIGILMKALAKKCMMSQGRVLRACLGLAPPVNPAIRFGCLPERQSARILLRYSASTPVQDSAPLTVNLDASGSSDPDPNGSIVSYDWTVNGQTHSGTVIPLQIESDVEYSIPLMITDN